MITDIRAAAKRSLPHLVGDLAGAMALAAMLLVALHSPTIF